MAGATKPSTFLPAARRAELASAMTAPKTGDEHDVPSTTTHADEA